MLSPRSLVTAAVNLSGWCTTGHLTSVPGIISDLIAVMFCSGVNLLLAIVLFSTIVGEMLPVTNNTPLIGQPAVRLLTKIHTKVRNYVQKARRSAITFNSVLIV